MSNEELSFMYFPEDYRWSHGVLIALNAALWGRADIGRGPCSRKNLCCGHFASDRERVAETRHVNGVRAGPAGDHDSDVLGPR